MNRFIFILGFLFFQSLTAQNSITYDITSDYIPVNPTVIVSDPSLVKEMPEMSLATTLLLSADLSGTVENPLWYFESENSRKKQLGMDALMLTQGWSRYDIPESMKGNYSEGISYIEQGDYATGLVKSRWKGKPMAGVTLQMLAPSLQYLGASTTESDGRFEIVLPDLPEGTDFVVQAINKNDGHEGNFELDNQKFPVCSLILQSAVDKHETDEDDDFHRYINSKGMNVLLGNVTVTGIKEEKDIFDILAAYTFDTQDFVKEGASSYEEVLRKIPGLVIRDGKVTFRSDMKSPSLVQFWVDGSLWESSSDITEMSRDRPSTDVNRERSRQNLVSNSLTNAAKRSIGNLVPMDVAEQMIAAQTDKLKEFSQSYPFDMIKRIQFFRPNEAIVFSRESGYFGGVLLFTTKNGSEINWVRPWNLRVYSPLGYQPKREFYVPKYDLLEDWEYEVRPTLYWIPRAEFDVNGQLVLPLPSTVSEVYVAVEGIAHDGTPISYRKKIE